MVTTWRPPRRPGLGLIIPDAAGGGVQVNPVSARRGLRGSVAKALCACCTGCVVGSVSMAAACPPTGGPAPTVTARPPAQPSSAVSRSCAGGGLRRGQRGLGEAVLACLSRGRPCSPLGGWAVLWAPLLPRPPGHAGVKPLHASALAPQATVFVYICLWSEVVTGQATETLTFP